MVKSITELKVEDVVKVYSGKPGCGCGCNGKYRVNPQHLELASKFRGYDYDKKEASLGAVHCMLTYLQQNAGEVEVLSEESDFVIYSLDTDYRYNWLFALRSNVEIEDTSWVELASR